VRLDWRGEVKSTAVLTFPPLSKDSFSRLRLTARYRRSAIHADGIRGA
jgi:hypothetical protein